MSFWRHLSRGFRVLGHRRAADQDVRDELDHFLEQETAAHMARGLAPADARRQARIALGTMTGAQERVRDYGWESAIHTVWSDLKLGARRLRSAPGFAVVAGATLALGVGASTAIFSVVNPILFRSLPYPRADRLLKLSDVGTGGVPMDVTYGTFMELSARSRSLAVIAASDWWRPALTDVDIPERLTGQRVTPGYFRTLGIEPAAGRDFTASDYAAGAQRVVIVSDAMARRRFGGAALAVGRPITLDATPYTIAGVMPPGFENVVGPGADVWSTTRFQWPASIQGPEWGHHMKMIARLTPTATVEEARREIAQIARDTVSQFPRPGWANMGAGFFVTPLRDDIAFVVRPALLAIVGAVLLVLLIACVNVTNLLLGRGTRRRGEFAMRVALGASRGRMIVQLLSEGLVLSAVGGALGLLVASGGVRALIALAPRGLPRLGAIHLDGAAFAFAALVTTVVGVAVGIAPAFHASRTDPHEGLQESTRRTSTGHGRTRRVLVVGEVALAIVLLVSAGLLLRSLERLFSVSTGMNTSNVLTMLIQTVGRRYDSSAVLYHTLDQELDAVRQLPGVVNAGFTSQLPLSGDYESYGYQLERADLMDSLRDNAAFRYSVTPGYFDALHLPLKAGRFLNETDAHGGPEAIVVSESFAKRKFPGIDPIGQRIRYGPEIGDTTRQWDVIVGVVGDVRQQTLASTEADAFYVTTPRWWWVDNVQSLVVRTSVPAATLAPAIRRAVWSVEKNQPITRLKTMDELVASSAAERRFALTLFEAFALAALALAAIGIYGVLSEGVSERVREIGVRSALGASRNDILSLIVRQGVSLAAIGVALGVVIAAATSGAMVKLLFGIQRLDPVTYAGVIVVLVTVALIASWIPAWRAARIDPSIALRSE